MAQFINWNSTIWLIEDGYRRKVGNPDAREIQEAYGDVRSQTPIGDASKYPEGIEVTTANAGLSMAEAEAKAAKEATIQAIVDTTKVPDVPYDEANPYAFDEALARAAAEQEYVPYYTELLEDYQTEVDVAKTRGEEDLARTEVDIDKELADYMEAADIRSQRNLEEFEEYGETMEERQRRLAEEKERGLEEYQIQRERSDQERAAYLEEARILEGRITEEERKALEEQGIDIDRILKLKEQYETTQTEGLQRLGETLRYAMETLGISGGRVGEDLLRQLESLTGEKESFMGKEERAWKEAVEQTQEGFSGRGLFFSGLRGDTLKKMGVERGAVIEDYMRGYKEATDLAEISAGRELADIARQKERTGVEFEWQSADIERAVEEYGQKAGWSMEDIERAKEEIGYRAELQREDIGRGEEEYERRYGYAMTDIERQQADMLRQAGYSEEDIARALGTAERTYGYTTEDIARGKELAEYGAGQQTEEAALQTQRFAEDLQRQQEQYQKGISREQEAAVLGGVQTREEEYGEEYEAGRQKYYEQYQYPNAYSMNTTY